MSLGWLTLAVGVIALVVGFVLGRMNLAAARKKAEQDRQTSERQLLLEVGDCLDALDRAARARARGESADAFNSAQERLGRLSTGMGFDFSRVLNPSAAYVVDWIPEAKEQVQKRLRELG